MALRWFLTIPLVIALGLSAVWAFIIFNTLFWDSTGETKHPGFLQIAWASSIALAPGGIFSCGLYALWAGGKKPKSTCQEQQNSK